MLHEKCDGKSNEIAADQVNGKRAKRQLRKEWIEPQPHTPAQPCANGSAQPDCYKCIKCHVCIVAGGAYLRHPSRMQALNCECAA